MNRPQFWWTTPRGFRDEPYTKPVTFGQDIGVTIPPGQYYRDYIIPLDNDAPQRFRSLFIEGIQQGQTTNLQMHLRDAYGNDLTDGYIPLDLYAWGAGSATPDGGSGRCKVFEPELVCPAGGFLVADFFNPGPQLEAPEVIAPLRLDSDTGPIFSFVQSTPESLSPGASTATFPLANEADNCIVVMLSLGLVPQGFQGATTDIADTQGNQYFVIQQSRFSSMCMYAAVNIKAGVNTVTATIEGAILAFEISSTQNYFVCPGSGQVEPPPPSISSIECSFQGAGSGPTFTSPTECFIAWGGWVNGTGDDWAAATGTVVAQGNIPQDFGCAMAGGIDDAPSVNPYANNITIDGSQVGVRVCIFLALASDGSVFSVPGTITLVVSCNNPPSGIVGMAYNHVFPASGGGPPYRFSISSGSLPPGVGLNASTGIASGIPSASGTYLFSVQVADSTSTTASVACSITIAGALEGQIVFMEFRGVKRFQECTN